MIVRRSRAITVGQRAVNDGAGACAVAYGDGKCLVELAGSDISDADNILAAAADDLRRTAGAGKGQRLTAFEVQRKRGGGFQRKRCAIEKTVSDSCHRAVAFGDHAVEHRRVNCRDRFIKERPRMFAVGEHRPDKRRSFCIDLVFVNMTEQIIGVLLHGIFIPFADRFAADDLSANDRLHFLGGDVAFENVVFSVTLGVLHHNILIERLTAGWDRKVHVRAGVRRDGFIQLHVEIHADIALQRECMTGKPCAHAVGKAEGSGDRNILRRHIERVNAV